MLPGKDRLRITSLHLAVGASWQTTITYINYSPQEVTCQTDFISDHGTPLMVSFAALETVVSRTDVLPPGGIRSPGDQRGPERFSCARLGRGPPARGPVQASLLYRLHNSEGAPTAEARSQCNGSSGNPVCHLCRTGRRSVWDRSCLCKPFRHIGPLSPLLPGTRLGRCWPSVRFGHCHPEAMDAHGMSELFDLSSFTGSIEVTSTGAHPSVCRLIFEAAPVFSSLPPGETPAREIPASDAPDLVVQTPSVSDSSLNAGESFMLSATVRNQGNGRSASTTLRYYHSLDATISTGDTEVGTDAVGSLTAAASSDQSISLTAPSTAGTYYYGACVDPVSWRIRYREQLLPCRDSNCRFQHQ